MKTLYVLEELSFSYGDHAVLQSLSLEIKEGEFVGVLGANGSGKTTLLRLLAGYLKPKTGSLSLRGKTMAEFSAREKAQRVAVVPQNFDVLFPFSVKEVVLMGRWAHLKPLAWESLKDRRIAHEAMELSDCLKFENRLVTELSGGEKERVLLARALAQEPEILLLDEPTTHLDLKHQADIFCLLKKLHQQKNLTIITVLHDLNFALRACEKLLLLQEGRMAAFGEAAHVLSAETVEQVFGVKMKAYSENGTAYYLPQMDFKF